MRLLIFSLVTFGALACGGPSTANDSGVPDSGVDAAVPDSGTAEDAGILFCRGSGSCVAFNENQCSVGEGTDAGCRIRRVARCGDRGTCNGANSSACTAGGACVWNGSSCARVNCTAQTTENDCLALACVWAQVFNGCEGTYDCQTLAIGADPSNPAQACGNVRSLGFSSCQP